VILGAKPGAFAVTFETCAFPSLGYEILKELGPGEAVLIHEEGIEEMIPPRERMQICAFLWVYYGYPASRYEHVNVEECRYRCGKALAHADAVEVDVVAGIPDSGTAHAVGYANERRLPYHRPFVKYTPTWPRSFMPPTQEVRDLVARMKLIPVRELIENRRLLFCEDSIVRGTQLKDNIERLFQSGAREIHMRPACPPLLFKCPFLNFSRSRSELDLAARKAVKKIEGGDARNLDAYCSFGTEQYAAMVDAIRTRLGLTSLKYQKLEDLIAAIGLPEEKLCTFCWTGSSGA
jgi:amidophosphoribosyltransferase